MEYIGYILLGLVVVIALYAVGGYNSLVSLRNQVEEAFSTMDVYLTKRYDLIPNLVETVKGYAKHEKETLEAVISARNKAVNATTMEGKIEAENAMSGVIGRLFALAESYPDLKANTNFLNLFCHLKSLLSCYVEKYLDKNVATIGIVQAILNLIISNKLKLLIVLLQEELYKQLIEHLEIQDTVEE